MRTIVIAGLWLLACRSEGQAPEIAGLLPHGGPRGSLVTIHVHGKNLQGARALIGESGVKIEAVASSPDGVSADVKLAVSPDALIGPRELRLYTPKGISGATTIWVDVF